MKPARTSAYGIVLVFIHPFEDQGQIEVPWNRAEPRAHWLTNGHVAHTILSFGDQAGEDRYLREPFHDVTPQKLRLIQLAL